jgi:phage tail P2-like protein
MANLLPPNATQLERNIAEVNSRLGDLPVPLRDLRIPADAPAAWLPWLADSLSVDAWQPSWTDSQKRASIASSIKVHRLKGTISAVREALGALGLRIQVQEWFQMEPRGEPYTFRLIVTADQVGYNKATLDKVQNVVNDAKNLRSHMSDVVPAVSSDAGFRVAAVAGIGVELHVKFDQDGFALMLEGIRNGEAVTEAAVDRLHHIIHMVLPSQN